MDITHDNVCSSMLSCFYSHLLSTGRPISSFLIILPYKESLKQGFYAIFWYGQLTLNFSLHALVVPFLEDSNKRENISLRDWASRFIIYLGYSCKYPFS